MASSASPPTSKAIFAARQLSIPRFSTRVGCSVRCFDKNRSLWINRKCTGLCPLDFSVSRLSIKKRTTTHGSIARRAVRVRGFLLNFGVYYATRAALGLAFQWSPSVVFITNFVTLFAMVIAITKDLPDVEGDRKCLRME